MLARQALQSRLLQRPGANLCPQTARALPRPQFTPVTHSQQQDPAPAPLPDYKSRAPALLESLSAERSTLRLKNFAAGLSQGLAYAS